jgi:hypothetical protein
MTAAIRAFVDEYKKQPPPKMTIAEFVKTHNRMLWRKCKCGNYEDIREKFYCSECGAQIDPNCK